MKQINRYPLHQSPLYLLSNKRKLADLLYLDRSKLKLLCGDSLYRVFTAHPKPLLQHHLFSKKERLVQEPIGTLRLIHARILRLLERIEIPSFLHSARKGRSYATNAYSHQNGAVFYKIDIRSFYTSIKIQKVFDFFHFKLLTSRDIAHALANLCCYKTFIPTGSCLSPLLSYFSNISMFDALNEYGESKKLRMTVYIDDIFFSGNNISKKFMFETNKIIINNGYTPHKQRLYRGHHVPVITGLALLGSNSQNVTFDLPNKRKVKILKVIAELNKKYRVDLSTSLGGMLNEASQFNGRFTTFAFNKLSRHNQAIVKFNP